MFHQPCDNPYNVLSKLLHLCWKVNSKTKSIEQPPAGYTQYTPFFILTKLQHCLSQVKTFEAFQTFDALRSSLVEGNIDQCTRVIGVIGQFCCNKDGEANSIPPSLMVCTLR